MLFQNNYLIYRCLSINLMTLGITREAGIHCYPYCELLLLKSFLVQENLKDTWTCLRHLGLLKVIKYINPG